MSKVGNKIIRRPNQIKKNIIKVHIDELLCIQIVNEIINKRK